MKKYLSIFLVVLLLCIISRNLGEAKAPVSPDVVNSISMGRDYQLIVIANRNTIDDKRAFAEELIQMCVDNTFETIRFSTDFGYPTELRMKVYASEQDWKKGNDVLMEVKYTQDSLNREYDIVNSPEKFKLVVE